MAADSKAETRYRFGLELVWTTITKLVRSDATCKALYASAILLVLSWHLLYKVRGKKHAKRAASFCSLLFSAA